MRIWTDASIFSHTRGHAEEDGRLHVAQVLGEGLAALAEVDDVAGGHRVDDRPQTLGDVAQRQVGQDLVARPGVERLAKARGRPQQVGVGDERALGRAGRARGVDDDRGRRWIERSHALRPRVDAARLRAAALEVVPGQQHRVVERADVARVDHHHVAQRGQALADRERLVELLLVLGHEHDRLRVLEQVLDLGRRAGRVDPDGHRAQALHGQVGEHPLRPVLGLHRDAVARPHPELGQRERDVRRALRVLRPGRLAPAPAPLLAQRDVAGALAGVAQQLGGQRAGLRRGLGLRGDGGHAAAPPR